MLRLLLGKPVSLSGEGLQPTEANETGKVGVHQFDNHPEPRILS
jgi:hypothetical protein